MGCPQKPWHKWALILCCLFHASSERQGCLKEKKEKRRESKIWRGCVYWRGMCCMHDSWGPREKGAWRKRNREGDSFKGEHCWFFCSSVQRSGRSGRGGGQGRIFPLQLTPLLFPQSTPDTPAGVSLQLPLMKPLATSPLDFCCGMPSLRLPPIHHFDMARAPDTLLEPTETFDWSTFRHPA